MCQFVPYFLSYISGKYYLNWFTVGKVITIIKGELFIETQHTSKCCISYSLRIKSCCQQ